MPWEMKPIARIRMDCKEKFGVPRQSGRVPQLLGTVVFEPPYRNPDALRGIEGFSHLWLIFDFSLCHREEWSPTVRPPRLGGNTRMGVFATRSPFRPNPVGLSCVRLLDVQNTEQGAVLIVGGADLVDGTPIWDIKPYLPYADCVPDAAGGYISPENERRLEVHFPPELLARIPEEKREALIACIAEDPRPAYQQDPKRIYAMRFAETEVRFTVSGGAARVITVIQREDDRCN